MPATPKQMNPGACPHDPFKSARQERGVLQAVFQGEQIPMILRFEEVRRAARDWQTFSSNAPFRVPIPSEEEMRRMRQLPIETDPPEHTAYRRIIEPVFRRPAEPGFTARIGLLVEEMVQQALAADSVEVVREFALPLQSRALTCLLNMPGEEAVLWASWGVHVFRDGGGGAGRGEVLERYLHEQFDRAEAELGEDFFSDLLRARLDGRPLSREELMGFANLVFAGGRDTIINTISFIIGWMASHPGELEALRADPRLILTAAEEFVRVVTPLTHIGRVCPVETAAGGAVVPAGGRVSLCWASANHDETVFEAPEEVRLDRRPNPHIAYGSGIHLCPGAAHARLVVRSLLKALSTQIEEIVVLDGVPNVETEECYVRQNAWASLVARFRGREEKG